VAKVEPPDSCDESQVAAAHSALGSYRDMRSPITSEAMDTDDSMGGENGQLTLTGKAPLASMETRALLDGPAVLFSHSDVARDFLRGVARDALTSAGKDVENSAPGHEAAVGNRSDARGSGSYYPYAGHQAASWLTQSGSESHHHQTGDPAATASRRPMSGFGHVNGSQGKLNTY